MKNACSATWSYSPSEILVKASMVSSSETVEAFNKIADGEYDHVAEQAFFMCGGLDDVERKWDEIQKSL